MSTETFSLSETEALSIAGEYTGFGTYSGIIYAYALFINRKACTTSARFIQRKPQKARIVNKIYTPYIYIFSYIPAILSTGAVMFCIAVVVPGP